ncbi:MAG: AEC family transporter [Marinovum sp.]|nr:AEC family transporter [Marinovum sp.]MDG2231513.1 AEC family transporter [Paracoccaceae bacterium]
MQALLDVIVPVFVVMGFGYLAVWRGFFSNSDVEGLMKFTQNFAIPCLLFKAIAETDLQNTFQAELLAAFYSGATISFFAGIFGGRCLFARDWEDCVAIGFCCLFSNSLMLGLAITERAYGPEVLATNFVIVALHAPFCYGLGIFAMEVARNRNQRPSFILKNVALAMFRNALVLGILAGFVFNLCSLSLPNPIDDAVDMIVLVALPTALFGMGGVLYQYRPAGDIGPIIMVGIISLLMHPILVWTFGRALALDQNAFRSAVVTSAMAPGINGFVFASIYERGRRVAASVVLICTAASIITVWGWLALLA